MSHSDVNTRLAELRAREKKIRKERKTATAGFDKQLARCATEREALQQTHLAEYLEATRLSRRNFLNNFFRFHGHAERLVWQRAPTTAVVASIDQRCHLIELLVFLPRENRMAEALFGSLGPMELFNLYTTTRPGPLQRALREALTTLGHSLLARLRIGYSPDVQHSRLSHAQLMSRTVYRLFTTFALLPDAARHAFVAPLLCHLQIPLTACYTAARPINPGDYVAKDAVHYLYDRERHCVTPLASLLVAHTNKLVQCSDRVEEKFRAKYGYTPRDASPLSLFMHRDLLSLGLVLVGKTAVRSDQLVLLCDDELHLLFEHERYELFSLEGGTPIDHYQFRQAFGAPLGGLYDSLTTDGDVMDTQEVQRAMNALLPPVAVMVIDE